MPIKRGLTLTLCWMSGWLFHQALPAYGTVEDVRMISSTRQECVLRFAPAGFRLESVSLGGQPYQRADFHLANPTGEPGQPEIPSRILVVSVPGKGSVRVSVVNAEFTEHRQVRLPPVPDMQKQDGLPVERHVEGLMYSAEGYRPESIVAYGEPEFVGLRRVVRIEVFPVQYEAVTGRIRQYTEIVLRVNFDAMPEPDPSEPSVRRQKTFLDRILVNPESRRISGQPSAGADRNVEKTIQTGRRFKIPVSSEGLYRITGATLSSLGVDIGSIDPETLKIYNNGGTELPRELVASRSEEFIQNPILLIGMDDDQFDESDYLVFYGRGVRDWKFDAALGRYTHSIHTYDEQNVYWLVFGDGSSGRRILSAEITPDGAEPVTRCTERVFYEQDRFNTEGGGIHWYANSFDNQSSSAQFDVILRDPVPEDTVLFRLQFKGATAGTHSFYVNFNNQFVEQVSFSSTQLQTRTMSLVQSAGVQNTLALNYTGSGVGSTAYLDWFEVEYRRTLMATESSLRIFSPRIEGKADFQISGFTSEPFILDVTDHRDIRQLIPRSGGSGWSFTDTLRAESPKRYFAATTPISISAAQMEETPYSHLREETEGAEYIIITPADFYDQALRLKTLREGSDSLSVFVVDVQDIFDEFGWGLTDPTAIRDFVHFAFSTWAKTPSYLLLFGDGDYDYRNILQEGEGDRIPPFEYDGYTESSTRASDDWYAYVSGLDYVLDLAVGRLPAQTVAEAAVMVDKIIAYETDPDFGDWRSLITMVGDDEKAQIGDENETTHTRAAEDIARTAIPSIFNFRKIYLSEYPEVIQIDGRRKPQARQDLIDQINRGTVLVNFVGHGNESVWAHERIFEQARDLPEIDNGTRYPLFYAATCAFARYDDPLKQSFSEDLLRTDQKGGIAVIAASRFCSASPNEALNKAFMTYLFSEDGPSMRLGDALRAAKLVVSNRVNNEMYHILGDPALRLSGPRYRAVFTSVEPDTLKALSLIRVEGRIEKNGSLWPGFGGEVFLKVFDAKKDVTYTTQYGTPLSYRLPGNAIFRGEIRANAGTFEFQFIVPKDISYGQKTGRFHCYFDDNVFDGGGYRDDVEIGGTSDLLDGEGPEIALSFTGRENFITGEMVSENPELVAVIRDDKTGVNITGEIGHTLQLSVDEQENADVTEYFQYDEGSYLQGRIRYRISSAAPGEHRLTLKAWDNANNSSFQTIMFQVVPEGELRVEDVLNYPNPFESQTHFTFKLNQDAVVEIKVYTLDGRLIRHIDDGLATAGFNMVGWDGRDEQGDELANGVYLYKLFVKSWVDGNQIKKEVIGRLMIFR